ncbi:MAG: hypothetical protein ACOYLS_01310 [Polymorphobacter sp.]
MATQRYTITQGQKAQQVVRAAGSAIASETVQLNVDFTAMTKGEILESLNELREAIIEGPWPPA